MLKSINWSKIKFDVLCIETEKNNRPPCFEQQVIEYMQSKGYMKAAQQGRNICKRAPANIFFFNFIDNLFLCLGFTRKDFIPSSRPGIAKDCFNGFGKSDWSERWWLNRRTPPFKRCELSSD